MSMTRKRWFGLVLMSPLIGLLLFLLGFLVYLSWLCGLMVFGLGLMGWLFAKGLDLYWD
jgi:hypothetical protein